MPVWYTYGTREASSPVCRGCSQQHQYDFWKQFNRIEVKSTRELEDPLLPEHGVDGDTSETLYPDIQHPDHYYTVQHFFNAEGRNYYNFALMHHKGHEWHQRCTAVLELYETVPTGKGWNCKSKSGELEGRKTYYETVESFLGKAVTCGISLCNAGCFAAFDFPIDSDSGSFCMQFF